MVAADEEPEPEWLLTVTPLALGEQRSEHQGPPRIHTPGAGGALEGESVAPVCAGASTAHAHLNAGPLQTPGTSEFTSFLVACDFLQTLQER